MSQSQHPLHVTIDFAPSLVNVASISLEIKPGSFSRVKLPSDICHAQDDPAIEPKGNFLFHYRISVII